MFICVGVIGLVTGGWLARNSALTAAFSPGVPASTVGVEGKAGPWGKLREVEIELQAPEKCGLQYCRTNPTKWCFHADSLAGLQADLLQYGCTEAQTAALIQTVSGEPRDLVLKPTLDLIWNLSPEVRSRCYFHLAECPKNPDQMYALRLKSDEFAERLASAPLAAATKEVFSPLAYTNGDYTYFADEPALNSRLEIGRAHV